VDVGKAGLTSWTVRLYEPGDEARVLDLFVRAYGRRPVPDYWEWKFGRNPVGKILAVLGFDDAERLVAHFAGVPVLAKVRDRVLPVCQGVDWMIDPEYRRGLRQGRVFAEVAGHFFTSFGNEADGALIFGVPIAATRRMLLGVLGQEDFAGVTALVRDLGEPLRAGRWRYRVRPVALDAPEVDALWARLAPQFDLATIRDRRYLHWRYAQCPLVRYEVIGVAHRWRGHLEGLAVLRPQFEGWPFAVLVDWLAPRDEPELTRRLLAAAEARARSYGQGQLMAWFPPGGPEARALIAAGYREAETPYRLVGSLHSPLLTLDWVREHWYFTGGDTDVF
jgi:hypothetical protein